MTAERYAAATDLVERYAAAFSSAVPDHPEDDGFYGPGSVTWRLAGDLGGVAGGGDDPGGHEQERGDLPEDVRGAAAQRYA